MKSLARYPMDPEAWVDGASDVKRVCEKNNWSCDGAVDVKKVRDVTPPAPVDVAPDIVNDAYEVAVSEDPGLLERPTGEVKAEIKDKITPHWKKKSTT